jgi:hypothetical protein
MCAALLIEGHALHGAAGSITIADGSLARWVDYRGGDAVPGFEWAAGHCQVGGLCPERGDWAIRYALSRWEALMRYVADGRLEIDNNPVERAVRPLALGRKNWLFAGSDTGGHRAAAIASLIITAKLNNLDPEAYRRQRLQGRALCRGRARA